MQNGYIERFNRVVQGGYINAYLFDNMNQIRNLSYEWMEDYNSNHPHDALGKIYPWNYTKENNKQLKEKSNLELSEKG